MTVISDVKKSRNQVSGLVVENEEDSLDANSNEIVDNQVHVADNSELIDDRESDGLQFPVDVMRRFVDMVNKPRWVVPVLPNDDLEKMLILSIKYAEKKKDNEIEHFTELYKNGFLVSFEKVMTDDAVSGWKMDILDSIYRNSIIMMKLCSMKILDDNQYLTDVLGIVFNPDSKYYQCNTNNFVPSSFTRASLPDQFIRLIKDDDIIESGPVDMSSIDNCGLPPVNENKYASNNDSRRHKVIYTDLINCFGHFDGFVNLKTRFENFEKMDFPDFSTNLSIILALLKPISLSIDFLTPYALKEFITPIAEKVVNLILSLDDTIKQDAIKEWKSDKFSTVIQHLEIILRRLNLDNDYLNQLALFRLNVILKILQHASFNGKMNALNELNKFIKSMYTSMYQSTSSEDRLNHIVKWIKANDVLFIVLKENLHQPQYVEKVEKLIRFMAKTNGLTNEDLDRLWDSQIGKHEAIVTNIHDLLAKLAYDFNPTQLQHLFDCFEKSWSKASKRQRERLIDLIRRLAEEDKDGRMAKTALNLLWGLAIQNDVPLDIMESALRAHLKILDFCTNQDRDVYRNEWLNQLVTYLSNQSNQKNSVFTLRQIKEIIKLFQHVVFHTAKIADRTRIIQQLNEEHNLLKLIADNLVDYVKNSRCFQQDFDLNENNLNYLDFKFPHEVQIDERLDILKFLLYEGSINLNGPLLTEIWDCLVMPHESNNSSHASSDRDQCFKWLANLMEFERNPFEENVIESFFQEHFLKLDPKLLTLSGILLFELFFRTINQRKDYIRERDSEMYIMQTDLIGLDYLWRCAMFCVDEEVFARIVCLFKTINTNLGSSLIHSKDSINSDFIQHCILILSSAFDTAKCLLSKYQLVSSEDILEHYFEVSVEMEESVNKLVNIIQILCEFIRECDIRYIFERKNPGLSRITYGQRRIVTVTFTNSFSRSNSRQFEIEVHSNEIFINLRKKVESHLKDLYRDGNYFEISKGPDLIIEEKDNYRTIEQLEILNGAILQTRLVPQYSNKLHANKSDAVDNFNSEDNEDSLPGVVISNNAIFMELLIKIGDLSLQISSEKLRWSINNLMNLLPPDQHVRTNLIEASRNENSETLQKYLHLSSPMQTTYTISVLYSLLLPSYCPDAISNSIILLRNLLKIGAIKVFLEMIHFENKHFLTIFVPKSCETYSIRLISLIKLLKIIYIHLSVLGSALQNKSTKIKKLHELFKDGCSHMTVPYNVVKEKTQSILKLKDTELPTSSLLKFLPVRKDVDSFIKLCWSCALGNRLELMSTDIKKFQEKCSSIAITERSRSVASFRPETSLSNINKLSTISPDIHTSVISNQAGIRNDTDLYDLNNQPTLCSLESLSLVLACSTDTNILELIQEKYTRDFIIVLLLYTRSSQIRRKSSEEFRLILRFSENSKAIEHVIQMLHLKLHNVGDNPMQYGDIFNLVVKLLNDSHRMEIQLPNTEALLKVQLERLLEIKSLPDNANNQTRVIHEVVLVGRLRILQELFRFFPAKLKNQFNEKYNLINVILDHFLFPSSRRYSDIKLFQQEQQREFQMSYDGNREFPPWATEPLMNPICNTCESQRTAFELLKVLVAGTYSNMKLLCDKLNTFFYIDHRFFLNEWDYKPSFVNRSATGYVGLKNAGATCYMNSILQQLFMITPIRNALLAVDAGPPTIRDDFDDHVIYNVRKDVGKKQIDTKAIKLDILREVQMIFGNLAFSQNQYFTPTGFWKHFKLWGDEVNLREQHDAVEFFTCLVDTVDEGLNSIGMPKIFEQVLGGTFADQKICKGCPHRYEIEEKFHTLSVDIRNHENLIESMEQYVKGDLLEGDNAYFCETCKEKRDTIKRMCIKKLPLVLAIQLKRFDYDWERETSVKFNDYFEFPNELDMAPYTVTGISRRDHLSSINDIIRSSSSSSTDSDCIDVSEESHENSTRYTLKGIVVHGGQASGGHYYSYIREKRKFDGGTPLNCSDSCSSVNNGFDSDDLGYCWYRFDDTEVTESKMDSDEMKNQWFGGDFMGETYDHIVKRVSIRRQKRWWSAYILFYEREDFANHPILNELQQAVLQKCKSSNSPSPMDGNNMFNITRLPRHIEENITLQNIEYMHTKNQYTNEYFNFLRELPTVVNPGPDLLPVKCSRMEMSPNDAENMKVCVATLLSQFLFSIGFKTNRSMRGPAMDWFDSLKLILRDCELARKEFCVHAFFFPLTKITEYLLESPNSEIRTTYVTFIKFISHWSLRDSTSGYHFTEFQRNSHLKELYSFIKERYPVDEKLKLAHILMSIMHLLLSKDTNEYGSCSNEYLSIFYDYPNMGYPELCHCLDINLPTHILKFCLDEYYPNPGSTRVDISKMICSFCQMMRCYDLETTTSDIQIEMMIPHRNILQQTYLQEPPDIPDSEITNPNCLYMNTKPIWKLRNIPDHLHRYLFTRTNKFIKRVVEDFYTDNTKDEFKKFLKYFCFNNLNCSQTIVETLSNELAHSFIRNVKLFLELFRNTLDIDDSLKIQRCIVMVTSEQLDFAVRFKTNSERRCYFIMKMILFAISKSNEDEKRQMWERLSNASQIHEKVKKALNNLSNVLHPFSPDRKVSCEFRQSVIDSNEENANNSIERTVSTEEMEKIGKEMLNLYINSNPEDSGFTSSEMDQSMPDVDSVCKKDDNISYEVTVATGDYQQLDPNVPPPYSSANDDEGVSQDDKISGSQTSSWSPSSMPSPK